MIQLSRRVLHLDFMECSKGFKVPLEVSGKTLPFQATKAHLEVFLLLRGEVKAVSILDAEAAV